MSGLGAPRQYSKIGKQELESLNNRLQSTSLLATTPLPLLTLGIANCLPTPGNVLSIQELIVAPNPANEQLTIAWPEEAELLPNEFSTYLFSFYDKLGRLVQSKATKSNQVTFDVSQMKSEVYILECVKDGASKRAKVLISH